MYEEKKNFEIVELDKDVTVYGKNLQNSGLPINFESLGKMWDLYSDEDIKNTKYCANPDVSYGLCLNKVPDYLVGVEVSKAYEKDEIQKEYDCFTMPKGKYLKISFNGENHMDLVCDKLMKREKEGKKWAKENKIKINGLFAAEVYPKATVTLENPEMYCLFPIL